MASILVVFESKYGQTSNIAERIGQIARSRSHSVRVVDVRDAADVEVASFESVIVLAPVYFGKHARRIVAFVRRNIRAFDQQRTAFISVSNSAASGDPIARDRALRLAHDTLTALGWRADVVATAGGALAYPRYNVLLRFVMRRIARANGAPTDTRRMHQLTSWVEVERALARFLEPLERDLAPAPAPAGPAARLASAV